MPVARHDDPTMANAHNAPAGLARSIAHGDNRTADVIPLTAEREFANSNDYGCQVRHRPQFTLIGLRHTAHFASDIVERQNHGTAVELARHTVQIWEQHGDMLDHGRPERNAARKCDCGDPPINPSQPHSADCAAEARSTATTVHVSYGAGRA